MIQVILKDKTNPYRAEDCVFKTKEMKKAHAFITGVKRGLIYSEWELKVKIGDIESTLENFMEVVE